MRVTIGQIAAEAGLSRITVSPVLQGVESRASAQTCEQVLAAQKLNYIPVASPASQNLRVKTGLMTLAFDAGQWRGAILVFSGEHGQPCVRFHHAVVRSLLKLAHDQKIAAKPPGLLVVATILISVGVSKLNNGDASGLRQQRPSVAKPILGVGRFDDADQLSDQFVGAKQFAHRGLGSDGGGRGPELHHDAGVLAVRVVPLYPSAIWSR